MQYVAEMVDLFSASSLRLCDKLEKECAGEGEGAKPRSHSHSHSPPQSQGGEGDAGEGRSLAPGVVEMESLFSRMTLDVIGKAVFNYEFDSLSKDTGIIEARSHLRTAAYQSSQAVQHCIKRGAHPWCAGGPSFSLQSPLARNLWTMVEDCG